MIYLIITASINNKEGKVDDEHRKQQYIMCIKAALDYCKEYSNIKTIVVENNGDRPTYLDNVGCDVVYTNNNSIDLFTKGWNELKDIKDVISKYRIDPKDTIIKLTGRYLLLNDSFFKVVQQNNKTHRAFAKFYNVCTKKFIPDDCVLGLMAMSCKLWKKFEYSIIPMTRYISETYSIPDYVSCEEQVARHINKMIPPNMIMKFENLGLECCFADDLRKLTL